MSAARELNVYKRIADGEYICRGDTLYTRAEMKEMLAESGFSLDEICEIYNLNADLAWRDMCETVDSGIITRVTEKDVKLSESGYTFKKLYSLHKTKDYLFYFCAVYLTFLVAYTFAVIVSGDDLKMLILFFGVPLVSCLAAFLLVKMDNTLKKKAKTDVEQIEDIFEYRMSSMISSRIREVYSLCNTLRMYECMEDAIASCNIYQ